jgi:hypothetical protein
MVNFTSSIGSAVSANDKIPRAAAKTESNPQLRKAFDAFVGESLFGQMLKSMRKTAGPPAIGNGGQAEEVFTAQLDQVLTEKLTKASASTLSGPMYELFTAARR